MPRRFSQSQRAALYLASGGRCTCGRELQPGWHADHVTPYVVGGTTDVINGQALCPRCNLVKGRQQDMADLRQWQQDAIDTFYEHNDPDFLVCATPGSGKTTFALELARKLRTGGDIARIAVIVPSDSLRQQWADAAGKLGIQLMPVGEADDYDKPGYIGYVATYQQLARGAGADLARRSTRYGTLAILDEVHHAGRERSWGESLRHAMQHAVVRVGLTGTPWRQDQTSPIPFVKYDSDGMVVVNKRYEYGEAVSDGVCRAIDVHAYDGQARWRDCGDLRSAHLGDSLPDDDVPAVLDAVFNPGYEWMPALLRSATDALDDVRTDVPDAGGLVVAYEQRQARAYADMLERLTGETPTLAISDDSEAKANIDAFRAGSSRWIVAVKMVSEGVDIPRLAVGVYATRVRTPLFFRQVVGRFVRSRPGEELNARLFIPAIPTLMQHAREIEDELRHQLDLDREREERARKGDQQQLLLRESIGATEAVFDSAIYQGNDISPDDYAEAEQLCRTYGFPLGFASNMARMVRDQPAPRTTQQPPVTPEPQTPQHRVEKMLRADVKRLAGKVAHRIDSGMSLGDAAREVNTALLKAGFPPRSKASIEQLEQISDYLARWLDGLA